MWWTYTLLSAFFAALTAVLERCSYDRSVDNLSSRNAYNQNCTGCRVDYKRRTIGH